MRNVVIDRPADLSETSPFATMKSNATTASSYLASLPPERREAITTVRQLILDNLDADLEERMQYGIVGYCVPHSVWPHGHHTKPELPLMYMGLSSQKNDMVVYMLFLKANAPERNWFTKAWRSTGRRAHLEVGGMGCCIRFKKLEELSLDVITQAMRRIPVSTYLEAHVAMLALIGKLPGGKVVTKGSERQATKAKTTTRPTARDLPKREPGTAKSGATPGTKSRAKAGRKRS